MADSPLRSPERAKRFFWIFYFVFAALMLVCLIQWNSSDPFARIDIFSGGYIVLSAFWVAASMSFISAAAGSKELSNELSGMTFDPLLLRAITILSVGELAVFLDYGHFHLWPGLQLRVLQSLGLTLYFLGAVWLAWTDRFLIAHFRGDMEHREVITDGPYQFVRHPRYTALLVSRVAFSLALASPIAWGFLVVWIIFVLRRIRLEEEHLHTVFGAAYDAYAKHTARLLPGVY